MSTSAEPVTGLDEPQVDRSLNAAAAAVRRRAVPIAIACGGILAAAAMVAVAWPAAYLSTGTLLAELPDARADAGGPGIAFDPHAQVQAIGRRILSPSALAEVIERHHVYEVDHKASSQEAQVARLREDIRLHVVPLPALTRQVDGTSGTRIAFTVGFEGRSPELAVGVAGDLVSLYLQANPPQSDPHSDRTRESLALDAARVSQSVADLEQRIAAFRQRNADRLPESADTNLAALSRAKADLRETEARISRLDRDGQRAADRDAAARRLEEARSWLAIDRERLGSNDPNVRRLELEVASLEKRLQGGSASGERAQLVAHRRDLKTQIESLEQAQLQMPVVAREYAALLQEIQIEQDRLDEVRRQQLAAGSAAREAARSGRERFTLVELPQRPERPIHPNRIAILVVGLLASIAAALGLMGILELRDTRVRGRRDVLALCGAPPLAVIPWVAPARHSGA